MKSIIVLRCDRLRGVFREFVNRHYRVLELIATPREQIALCQVADNAMDAIILSLSSLQPGE